MDPLEFDSKQEEQTRDESAAADLEAEAFTSFNPADIRLKLQEVNQHLEAEENLKRRQRLLARTVVIIAAGLTVLVLMVWAGSMYRTNQMEQQAALTLDALAARYQSAENFMNAGRPEEALRLYNEIQQMSSAYKDVDLKIQQAQEAITLINLYQQGVEAFEGGNSDQALEILAQVEKLHPNYRDTSQLRQKIAEEKQIALLAAEIEVLYTQSDWAGVVRNYEAIKKIDPFIELPELRGVVFDSYRQLILELAERSDLTLEDIETSDRYYRSAIALVPQDKGYVAEREELQKIAVDRLANKYYLNAINLLQSSNYSIKGLQEALRILSKADNIGTESPAIKAEIEKAQLFLDAYDSLAQRKWDDAVTGFEELQRKEENYAGGRVKYFLYEAYTARGDMLYAYADFEGALIDYQEAEKFAWGDKENSLRLFQIEVRVAASLSNLGNFDEAAEFYHYAFKLTNYQKRLTRPGDQELLDTIKQAELAYASSDAAGAVRLYEAAIKQHAGRLYVQKTLAVKQGDSLANIAFEHGSSIEALRIINEFGESLVVDINRDIIVPTMPVNAP